MESLPKSDQSIYTRTTDIFIESALLCSFSAAAKRLGVSQSSVSQSIRHLEDALGFDLFERDSRPLRLTPEANLLLEKLIKDRKTTQSLIESFRRKNQIKPRVSLGLVASIATFIGVELTTNLKVNVSQLSIFTGTSEKLIQQLDQRQLDIATIPTANVSEETFNTYLLYEEPWVLFWPKSHGKDKVINSWLDLKISGIPFIHHSKDTANEKVITRNFENIGIDFPNIFEANDNLIISQFVRNGIGWALTQCYGFEPSNLEGIEILQPPMPLENRKVFLVTRKNIPKDLVLAVHQNIIELMEENLNKRYGSSIPWYCEQFVFNKYINIY